MRYIFLLLLFVFSCKGQIDSGIKNSLLKVLSENQKVHEILITKENLIPDTKALLESVQQAKIASEKNESIKKQIEKMESTLTNINTKDQEAFFNGLSSFSETLTEIIKANQIQTEYNKFYCPMVAKYWVAKGEMVQNPYAPDMRECGELVKE
ncbi:MAG TPA: hypothetical protein PK079_21490 [Leptospiraceae bacterium]|nr:hypothetical protein [Leptospiraceae bacterium]HMW08392.1 hypothetical protein [Leptospiraceae bacterium]HMX33674.1 hypothetical protein [Leptospiraceae bacterium]HMY34111.1 hypothetical protein [Leptospiraceae bacterium]HMZ65976.1 hypothetical protein [Leptospiraceae bacterium]